MQLTRQFSPEAEVWWGVPEFNLLAHNITVPGLSPLFPDVHCTPDYNICQLVTGEGEINAAVTLSSLVSSPIFDLTRTYFLVAGIAGVNPKVTTINSVTFARYAVQVALQYQIDLRELPDNYSTSYIPQGAQVPFEYPTSIYGTEVFELNAELRSLASSFAGRATLADSDASQEYRAKYTTSDDIYAAGMKDPSVMECDVTTTDVYFSGRLLSEAFGNTTTVLTNGTGVYCSTAQEDNATLEALLRAAKHKLVDFSRIIVMRTGSDFERPYEGQSAPDNPLYADQGAFEPAVQNLYNAGVEVVKGILSEWNNTFAAGVKPRNYIGDMFGTLGGQPDFGPGRHESPVGAGVLSKRSRSGLR